MNMSTQPPTLPEGVWKSLLAHAFTLVDEIARRGLSDPFWTFGGGTVLMLRPEGEIDFVASPNLTAQPYDEQHRADISAICQRYKIRRLEVFGSAARGDDFDAERSDADFLVEFSTEAPADLQRFFGIKSELESLLGRGVDLVEPGAVRNPFVLARINRHREAIYAT